MLMVHHLWLYALSLSVVVSLSLSPAFCDIFMLSLLILTISVFSCA